MDTENQKRDAARLNWHAINSAPRDREIGLAVIDEQGEHSLSFPCRWALGLWMNAKTRQFVDVRPTHWREWPQAA